LPAEDARSAQSSFNKNFGGNGDLSTGKIEPGRLQYGQSAAVFHGTEAKRLITKCLLQARPARTARLFAIRHARGNDLGVEPVYI